MWRWRVCSLAFVLAACDSGPLASDIKVSMQALLSNNVLGFYVSAYDISANYAVVDDATIAVTFRGQTTPLVYTASEPLTGYYATRAQGSIDADELFSFSVSHGDSTASFEETMPADFTITPPSDPRIGAPVAITWTPVSPDAMDWSGDSCNEAHSFNGPLPSDTGVVVLPSSEFSPDGTACDVQFFLNRKRSKTASSVFASAYVEVDRGQEVEFSITP